MRAEIRIMLQLALASSLGTPILFAQAAFPEALYQASWPNVNSSRWSEPSTLSSEAEDDPTLSVDAYDHQPAAGARRAARRAERLSAKNRHDEAIEELKRALAIDPQYYLAANSLALEFKRAGKLDLAIATLERLSKSAPNRVLAFNNLAEILYDAQRFPEMQTVARQAQKIRPYSFRANFLLGLALVRQGSWNAEAKADLQYASLRHPEAKSVLAEWPVR